MVIRHKIGNRNNCTACAACFNVCSMEAIKMIENEEGFLFPKIDFSKCIECMQCEYVCPVLNKNNISDIKQTNIAYYGWHKDDRIRKLSSSGGIFSSIADYVLNNNGVIFGAVYDSSEGMVLHRSSLQTELHFMRKSKYVQSYIGNTFSVAKQLLDDGKFVLFTGTPCQIDGLQNFLGGKYNRLITLDFICHGVPPMRLLRDNLSYLEKKYKIKITHFDFRPKIEKWAFDYFLIYTISKSLFIRNNKAIKIPWLHDPFFNGFIKNLTLRVCCYNCRYSQSQHKTDLTVADFWGYQDFDKNILDERGISLVLANTEEGNKLLSNIINKSAVLNSLDWKYVEYVFKIKNPEKYNLKKRNAFFSDYTRFGYIKAIKMHLLLPNIAAVARYHVGKKINKYKLIISLKNKIRKHIFKSKVIGN